MSIQYLTKVITACTALALLATGAWATGESEEAAAESTREMITDPTSGAMFTPPRYGGTLTLAHDGNTEVQVDSFAFGRAYRLITGVVQKLAMMDWGVDRSVYAINSYNQPVEYMVGMLTESWESPDALTTIFKIRPEVRWHDKAPLNGRPLVAGDIVFNYRRYLGMDGGEVSASTDRLDNMDWDSITAPDDSTVVFKLNTPHAWFPHDLLWHEHMYMYAPEQIQNGTLDDWRALVGTGPFMVSDIQEGSSVSWERNPNYWGVDEKYGNQLPYVDGWRFLALPDNATRLAALRTGRIDGAFNYMGAGISQLEDLQGLLRTNPDIQAHTFEFRGDFILMMNHHSKPLDDIRVRRAIQQAINFEEINNVIYDGMGNASPRGMSARNVIEFEDWPAAVQEAFQFDPAESERLLDEAGLARGSDGVRFSLEGNFAGESNITYFQLVGSYLADVGIDVAWQMEEGPNYAARMTAAQYDIAMSEGSSMMIEEHLVGRFTEGYWGYANSYDAAFEAKFKELQAATSFEEWEELWKWTNMFLIENHWLITGVEQPRWNVMQPWIQGWSGELMLGRHLYAAQWARLWIDEEIKAEYLGN